MSTVADWDADVEAKIIALIPIADSVIAGHGTDPPESPERYASDLRRGRIGTFPSNTTATDGSSLNG